MVAIVLALSSVANAEVELADCIQVDDQVHCTASWESLVDAEEAFAALWEGEQELELSGEEDGHAQYEANPITFELFGTEGLPEALTLSSTDGTTLSIEGGGQEGEEFDAGIATLVLEADGEGWNLVTLTVAYTAEEAFGDANEATFHYTNPFELGGIILIPVTE